MIAEMKRELQRLGRMVRGVVRRGLLDTAVGADSSCQVAGAGDDKFLGVEFWQTFGIASRPPVGGEVLAVMPYAGGEGAIVVASRDRSHAPAPAAGEVTIYGLKSGSVQGLIKMRSDGEIRIIPGTGKTIDAGADGTSTNFSLLGTTFDTALRVLVTAINTWATACGTGFSSVGTAMTALGGDAALAQATKDACNLTATAMGVAASACTVAASACTTFLGGSYLATRHKVT
jgi:phage gp45-like